MNHSKKHSSLQDQQERHDGMIQRRTTVTREELPVVPMFPGVDPDLPSKNYSLASLGLDSLGCEGDAQIDQKALNELPQISVFVAASEPAPSPTPAEPEKTAPAPGGGPCFGIWSDGTLALRVKAGFVELESAEFAALLEFVDRVRKGRVL